MRKTNVAIVLPEFQGRGIGPQIMERVMAYLQGQASTNAFIGLMAAKDVAPFYRRFGFTERLPNRPGMFQVWKG